MEIGLPNENGRWEILKIHTAKMYQYEKISEDVDLKVTIYLLLLFNIFASEMFNLLCLYTYIIFYILEIIFLM